MLEAAVRKTANLARKFPVWFVLCFFIMYMIWFGLLEEYRDPVIIVYSRFDAVIPFVPVFIVPYLLWFFYISLTTLWFFKHSREDFWNLVRYMFTGMTLALVIYTIVPTGLHLRTAVTGTDIFSRVVRLLYVTDTSTNVCPSIHVMNSIAVNVIVQRYNGFRHPRLIKTSSYVLAVLICASTVLLKQHSVIDVFWAIVMEILLYSLSYKPFFAGNGVVEQKKTA